MVDQANIGLGLTVVSAFLVLLTWIFRFRIAELGKKKGQTPTEVLFGGYEKLLKQYQDSLIDRDAKYRDLENSFTKLQDDLNGAREAINELREEDARKAGLIKDMELTIAMLRGKPATAV